MISYLVFSADHQDQLVETSYDLNLRYQNRNEHYLQSFISTTTITGKWSEGNLASYS